MKVISEHTFIYLNSFAFIGSFTVLLTGLMFYNRLVRKKIYMKMILMVSFCDLVGDIGGLFGFPVNANVCRAQACLILYCYRTAWLWCACITSTLYTQIMYNRIYLKVWQMSLIVYGVDIFFLLIPLPFGIVYGGCEDGTYWGGISMSGSPVYTSHQEEVYKVQYVSMWYVGIFFVPLTIYLGVMVGLSAYLYFVKLPLDPALQNIGDIPSPAGTSGGAITISSNINSSIAGSSGRVEGTQGTMNGNIHRVKIESVVTMKGRKAIRNVLLYPMLMIVCWFPFALAMIILVGFIMSEAYWDEANATYLRQSLLPSVNFLFYWGSSYGGWLAIAFFYKSSEARRMWKVYLNRNVWKRFLQPVLDLCACCAWREGLARKEDLMTSTTSTMSSMHEPDFDEDSDDDDNSGGQGPRARFSGNWAGSSEEL